MRPFSIASDMKPIRIDKRVITERIETIQLTVVRLKKLRKVSAGKMMLPDNFAIAEHNLRYALEATFDICSHILARIPGAEAVEYKKMALEMGRQGIVPMKYAEETLLKMAGYRNRLTHFYFEVTPREMHEIIKNNLNDFEIFISHIKKFLVK